MTKLNIKQDISSIEEAAETLIYLEEQKGRIMEYIEHYMIETLEIDDKEERRKREEKLKILLVLYVKGYSNSMSPISHLIK